MSDAALSQIVGLLPKLDPGEVAALQVRLKALGANGLLAPEPARREPRERGSQRADIDWLAEGYIALLRARGQLGPTDRPPRHVLDSISPKYTEHAKAVQALINRQMKRRLTAQEETQLGRVCAEALADLISSWSKGPPVGVKSLLDHTWRIPEALEASFPGYLRSGLLPLLLKGSPRGGG